LGLVPEFCVGQKVTFVTAWNGSTSPMYAPPNVVWPNTIYVWALSSTFVNRDTPGTGGASDTWDIDPASLNSVSPFGYWTTGGGKNAYLHETVFFSNGQSVTLYAGGYFKMFKPHAVMINPHVQDTPNVIWESPWFDWIYGQNGAIQLGVQGGTGCMAYDLQVISSDYAGDAKITQLCSIVASGPGFNYTDALDGSDPYNPTANPGQTGCAIQIFKTNNPPAGLNTFHFDDAPDADTSMGNLWLKDSFIDYVMFKPSGDGIYVPLAKVTWDTGAAQVIFPSTDIIQNSDKGPHGPTDSDEFPIWTTTRY
jgi:hypothetical protein